jgi:hypothetical protein
MEFLGLVLAVVTLIGVLPAAIQQYRTDRAGFWKTARQFGLYLAYLAIVIGVMLWLLSGEKPSVARAMASGVFGVTAIFYGALWLMRLVPRYRTLPAFIDRFPGGLDYGF